MDSLIFECSSMKNGEIFSVENTGRGQDISPENLITGSAYSVRNHVPVLHLPCLQ